MAKKNPLTAPRIKTAIGDDTATPAGVFTTEFWLAVLCVVASTLLLAIGAIDQATWRWVIGPVVAGYAIGRGLAKQ